MIVTMELSIVTLGIAAEGIKAATRAREGQLWDGGQHLSSAALISITVIAWSTTAGRSIDERG